MRDTASIKGMKTTFDVLIGCRQGGQESPCNFNYYFDYVLKVATQEMAILKTWNVEYWNGMEWNGLDWNGLEWTGMDWNGLEWPY